MSAGILVLLLAICSACADSRGQPPTSTSQPSATAPASALVTSASYSGAFSSTSYEDTSGSHLLVDGTFFIVEFVVEGGQDIIRWTGGCNGSGTTYTVLDGHLHLGSEIGSTTVLCQKRLMDQDDFLYHVLLAAPSVAISASALRLVDSDVTIALTPTTKTP